MFYHLVHPLQMSASPILRLWAGKSHWSGQLHYPTQITLPFLKNYLSHFFSRALMTPSFWEDIRSELHWRTTVQQLTYQQPLLRLKKKRLTTHLAHNKKTKCFVSVLSASGHVLLSVYVFIKLNCIFISDFQGNHCCWVPPSTHTQYNCWIKQLQPCKWQ